MVEQETICRPTEWALLQVFSRGERKKSPKCSFGDIIWSWKKVINPNISQWLISQYSLVSWLKYLANIIVWGYSVLSYGQIPSSVVFEYKSWPSQTSLTCAWLVCRLLALQYLFLPLLSSLKNSSSMWFPLPSTNSTEIQTERERGETEWREKREEKRASTDSKCLCFCVFTMRGNTPKWQVSSGQKERTTGQEDRKIPSLKRIISLWITFTCSENMRDGEQESKLGQS